MPLQRPSLWLSKVMSQQKAREEQSVRVGMGITYAIQHVRDACMLVEQNR